MSFEHSPEIPQADKIKPLKLEDKVYMSSVNMFFTTLKAASSESFPIKQIREKGYFTSLKTLVAGLYPFVESELKANIVEGATYEKNEAYRPFIDSIKEGVSLYQNRNIDCKVTYTVSEESVTLGDILDSLQQPVNEEDRVYIENLVKKRPLLYSVPDFEGKSILDIIAMELKNGSSSEFIQTLIINHLPKNIQNTLSNAEVDAQGDDDVVSIKESVIPTIRKRIENFVIENSVPILTSEVLSYCLDETNGSLNEALDILASLFKYSARYRESYDYQSLGYSREEWVSILMDENAQWMQEHILDEYSLFVPFNFLPDEEQPYNGDKDILFKQISQKFFPGDSFTRMNRFNYDYSKKGKVGLPYHTVHMVALLKELPPELITIAMLGEYIKDGDVHGLSKFLSDLTVCSDLYNIKNYLTSLNT